MYQEIERSSPHHKFTLRKFQLVAKDFSQVGGVNFIETIPPTPASTLVKMVIADANKKGLPGYTYSQQEAFRVAQM